MPPVEPLYLVAGYDPGELQTHWVVCAVTAGGELWVIDWGTILSFRTEGGRKGVAAHFPGLLYQAGDHIFQPALGISRFRLECGSYLYGMRPDARPALPHKRIRRGVWRLEPHGLENTSGP